MTDKALNFWSCLKVFSMHFDFPSYPNLNSKITISKSKLFIAGKKMIDKGCQKITWTVF